jgi:hypothetical protein
MATKPCEHCAQTGKCWLVRHRREEEPGLRRMQQSGECFVCQVTGREHVVK